MGVKCEIKFDSNNYGIYFAGQTMTGRVELTLNRPKKVRGISLNIDAFAKCEWRESHGRRRKGQASTNFLGRETYINSKTYFVGSVENPALSLNINGFASTTWAADEKIEVNGKTQSKLINCKGFEEYLTSCTYLSGLPDGNPVEIQAGEHVYNFSCLLPPLLPTSFEGRYGHIRYTICVTLERPWKFDQTYRVGFTVLKAMDLNLDTPELRIPAQMDLFRTFCCGPCRSGPFTMTASIPMSGYVPGQLIVVVANIVNKTNVRVEEVKFSLKKKIAYISQTPIAKIKFEDINISEVRNTGVKRKDDGRFEKNLPIPPVPPTNTSLCKIIQITYEVHVEAKVPGAHQNPLIKIPITIGTIPLNNASVAIVPYNPNNFASNLLTSRPEALTASQDFNFHNGANFLPSAPVSSPSEAQVFPTVARQPGASSTFSSEQPGRQVDEIAAIRAPINPSYSYNTNDHRLSQLPPPSYEQCVSGTTQINDAGDQHPIASIPFAPMYPVYSFNSATQQTQNQEQLQRN